MPFSSRCAGDRDDLLAREVARGLRRALLLFGEAEVHGADHTAGSMLATWRRAFGDVAARRADRGRRHRRRSGGRHDATAARSPRVKRLHTHLLRNDEARALFAVEQRRSRPAAAAPERRARARGRRRRRPAVARARARARRGPAPLIAPAATREHPCRDASCCRARARSRSSRARARPRRTCTRTAGCTATSTRATSSVDDGDRVVLIDLGVARTDRRGRRGARHARVHGARAGARRGVDAGDRRVRARRRAVGAGRRRAAVPPRPAVAVDGRGGRERRAGRSPTPRSTRSRARRSPRTRRSAWRARPSWRRGCASCRATEHRRAVRTRARAPALGEGKAHPHVGARTTVGALAPAFVLARPADEVLFDRDRDPRARFRQLVVRRNLQSEWSFLCIPPIQVIDRARSDYAD